MSVSFLIVLGWLGFYIYSKRAALAHLYINGKFRLGEYDEALRRLRQVGFCVSPTFYHHREGLIFLLAGRPDEAERSLRDAIALMERGARYPRERLYSSLGYALTDLGRFREAEESFQQAIRLGDITGNSHNGIAELRLAEGRRFDEALEYIDQAIEMAGRRVNSQFPARYYTDRAWALALVGRVEEARESLRKGLQLPVSTAAGGAGLQWCAGMVLRVLREDSEADEHFRAGREADPQGKYGRLCLEQLNKSGVAFRASTLRKPRRSLSPLASWRSWSTQKKSWAAGAVLLALSFIVCPLVMRVNPGPAPDFSASGSVHRFSAGRWTAIDTVDGGIGTIGLSRSGAVWAAPPDRNGILHWDGSRWNRYADPDTVGGFAIDGNTVWAATKDGVARFDGQSWHSYPEATRKPPATAIAAGLTGVWAADSAGSLSRFDGRAWTFEKGPGGGEDATPELRVTSDGALWLLRNGLWRRDLTGWHEMRIQNVDWSSATLAGQDEDRVWLNDGGYLVEVRPDGMFGATFDPHDLPILSGAKVYRVAAANGKIWLATTKDLLFFDGGRWTHCGIPPETTLLTDVALGPDGSAWVVSETRSVWRVALWVAPPLGAAALALLVIGGLLVMWVQGGAEKRLAADRAILAAAGDTGGIDADSRESQYRRQLRGLWWKVPAFLIGFPYLYFVLRWGRTYIGIRWPELPAWIPWTVVLTPVALAAAFLGMRWRRAKAPSLFGIELRIVFLAAILVFVLHRLPLPQSPLGGWLLMFLVVFLLIFTMQSRNILAVQLTKNLWLSGQYDRALKRLRWISLGSPTAHMLQIEGVIHALAGRSAEAERCHRLALNKAGNSDPAFRRNVLCALGFALTDQTRYDEALRCLETVIDMGDRTGSARIGIAEILLEQGKDPEKALGLIEEAMRVNPKKSAERDGSRAWALALLGRPQEMDESMAAALRTINSSQPPVVASVHWRIGKALAAVNRVSQAIEHFRTALRADPNGHHGQIARLELQHYGAAL